MPGLRKGKGKPTHPNLEQSPRRSQRIVDSARKPLPAARAPTNQLKHAMPRATPQLCDDNMQQVTEGGEIQLGKVGKGVTFSKPDIEDDSEILVRKGVLQSPQHEDEHGFESDADLDYLTDAAREDMAESLRDPDYDGGDISFTKLLKERNEEFDSNSDQDEVDKDEPEVQRGRTPHRFHQLEETPYRRASSVPGDTVTPAARGSSQPASPSLLPKMTFKVVPISAKTGKKSTNPFQNIKALPGGRQPHIQSGQSLTPPQPRPGTIREAQNSRDQSPHNQRKQSRRPSPGPVVRPRPGIGREAPNSPPRNQHEQSRRPSPGPVVRPRPGIVCEAQNSRDQPPHNQREQSHRPSIIQSKSSMAREAQNSRDQPPHNQRKQSRRPSPGPAVRPRPGIGREAQNSPPRNQHQQSHRPSPGPVIQPRPGTAREAQNSQDQPPRNQREQSHRSSVVQSKSGMAREAQNPREQPSRNEHPQSRDRFPANERQQPRRASPAPGSRQGLQAPPAQSSTQNRSHSNRAVNRKRSKLEEAEVDVQDVRAAKRRKVPTDEALRVVRSGHGEVAKYVEVDDESSNEDEGASTDNNNAVIVRGQGRAAVRHSRIPQPHNLAYYDSVTRDFLQEVRQRWMLFIITENAYPVGEYQVQAMQAAFDGAAQKLPQSFRGSRVQKFDKHIRSMLKHAANEMRGLAKTTAKQVVVASYELLSPKNGGHSVGRATIANLVETYLNDYEWIKGDYYPPKGKKIPGMPFAPPVIQDVIAKMLFHQKPEGISLRRLSPVPGPVIAWVCTAIKCALDEWSSGEFQKVTMAARAYRSTYTDLLALWKLTQQENPNRTLIMVRRITEYGMKVAGVPSDGGGDIVEETEEIIAKYLENGLPFDLPPDDDLPDNWE